MNPPNLQSLLRGPSTDPLQLYRCRDALYATDLLAAALVWLDLFTVLDRRPSDLPALCEALDIRPRPADVLMTLLQAMGLVERRDGLFHVTPVAREHLVQGSPWYLGPYYASMKDRPVTLDYVKVLRTGKPSNWASLKDTKAWAQAMEEDAFAKQFTAAMDCRGLYLGTALARAIDLNGRRLVLDVAGGSGVYACCLTSAFPGLRGLVFEKPPVDRIARHAIAERGCSERVDVVAGDMFQDEWPARADTHLISNVLHDWDVEQVMDILRRSHRALPAGGWLLAHDMHINADKTGPLAAAQYSALLMSITEGKCYSEGEMAEMLGEIGFTAPEFFPTAADRSVLLCRKR
ncbi:MAG: methyltransferase [Verrucomicrobia bacterium]|nr:methyltransferase [Verrucomicrobiota bacterium]